MSSKRFEFNNRRAFLAGSAALLATSVTRHNRCAATFPAFARWTGSPILTT